MIQAVFLDSAPLGLVTQRARKSAEGDACRAWMETLLRNGIRVYIPEIIDYEVRRELLRADKTFSIVRLDRLKAQARYLPLTTSAMLRAADLWSSCRRRGIVTADAKAIDADVILCAQALTLGLARTSFVVATSNIGHLGYFVPAQSWENITP